MAFYEKYDRSSAAKAVNLNRTTKNVHWYEISAKSVVSKVGRLTEWEGGGNSQFVTPPHSLSVPLSFL